MRRVQNRGRIGIVLRGLGAKKYTKNHYFSKSESKNHENHRKFIKFIENQCFSQVHAEVSFRRRGPNQKRFPFVNCMVYEGLPMLLCSLRYFLARLSSTLLIKISCFLLKKSWFFIDFWDIFGLEINDIWVENQWSSLIFRSRSRL